MSSGIFLNAYLRSLVVVPLLSRVCLSVSDRLQHTRFPVLHYLLELAQIHVHWIDDAIQQSHPLSPPSLFLFNLSQHQGLFQWVSSLYQEAKGLELQLQHQSFQWIFGVDLLYIDWLDLLLSKGLSRVVYSTHSKALVLGCSSAFFMIQLSHLYMTGGKNKALTIQTFVSKVMSLLCNMLSRFVITFLPRSKHLLISWLQLLSAVILEPKKIKCPCFHFFPIYFPWSDGTSCCDLSFLNVEF